MLKLKEYQFINKSLIVFALLLGVLLFLFNLNGIETCQIKIRTGLACSSCGLTRDIISFLSLDFKNPINKNSLIVFIFLLVQLVYRSTTSLLPVSYNTGIGQPKTLKRIILMDIIVTAIWGASVCYPFWD